MQQTWMILTQAFFFLECFYKYYFLFFFNKDLFLGDRVIQRYLTGGDQFNPRCVNSFGTALKETDVCEKKIPHSIFNNLIKILEIYFL